MSYRLEILGLTHEAAFLVSMDDYAANDAETTRANYPGKWTPAEFRKFVQVCEKGRHEWRPKANQISETRYVLIDDRGSICANGVMRFPLSEKIEASGGNLIFDVPPARRRQGFSALVLNRMLFEAVRAGLSRVLLTCAKKNKYAQSAIMKNRAQADGEFGGLLRFWINLR